MVEIKVGERFKVFNGDAKGTVEAVTPEYVAYVYDHNLETRHTNSRKWFETATYPIKEVSNARS